MERRTDYTSRKPLRDALERHAAQELETAMALELAALRHRTSAKQLGRLATQYGGMPPLRLVPMPQPEHDEAA